MRPRQLGGEVASCCRFETIGGFQVNAADRLYRAVVDGQQDLLRNARQYCAIRSDDVGGAIDTVARDALVAIAECQGAGNGGDYVLQLDVVVVHGEGERIQGAPYKAQAPVLGFFRLQELVGRLQPLVLISGCAGVYRIRLIARIAGGSLHCLQCLTSELIATRVAG
ncbi:hypothetical protein D3C81_756060 [compost metagenome]